MMVEFSANLGFLWQELPLPQAIRAAKAAGFAAVECHWPYGFDSAEVKSALAETGLQMMGINTVRGNVPAGENGLAALPGRESEARAAIDQALSYAGAIGAANVHVMAGKASGPAAHDCFVANLRYASAQAAALGITILIEPLNERDAPGYFLRTTGQATDILSTVNAENLKIMFDCYHVQIMEGDLSRRLADLMAHIGHIQIASVPDRSEPDGGEVDYRHIFRVLEELGYHAPIGAEYRPARTTEAGLGWLARFTTAGGEQMDRAQSGGTAEAHMQKAEENDSQ